MVDILRRIARQGIDRVVRPALRPVAIIVIRSLAPLVSKIGPRTSYPPAAPTAQEVIANYPRGLVLFGHAGSRLAALEWRSFPVRAVITPETAKVPKRLRPIQRRGELEVRFDEDFEAIIRHCQEGRRGWLTKELIDIYLDVHRLGFGVTVGTYRDGRLVAGIWGLGVGGVFGIMSMFHTENHAGALAMAALSDAVSRGGRWSLVDCGLPNGNFARYGAAKVSQKEFCELVWRTLIPCLPTSEGVSQSENFAMASIQASRRG